MEINYFDLSGGINQSLTKTELGANTKRIYWTDSNNIEIFENKGIIKQKGNQLMLQLPVQEAVTAMSEMEANNIYKLVITTYSGKIYIYNSSDNNLTLLNKTLTGKNVKMVQFLRGVIVSTESDAMFYIKNNSGYDIEDCNLLGQLEENIYPDWVTIYKGRVWCADSSTIYYSALGMYNDFSTPDDAGYISDFHTDTSDIIGMHTYKDYLAIYKKERVYLLSGSSPEDFSVLPFAQKGSVSPYSIVNVENKQYFMSSNGIFALEQSGELNQIILGAEISLNIKEEFHSLDFSRIKNSKAIHYEDKSQIWFFFPYTNNLYYNNIWIYDYLNKAWYKRTLPQNITTSCIFESKVLTADDSGKIYREDIGATFNGSVINFMWKSPFLSLTNVFHRKMIDEFYLILDDSYENRFNFSTYKDFDSTYCEDVEAVFAKHYDQLIWADNSSPDGYIYKWPDSDYDVPVWSICANVSEKTEICGSFYSVQLCIEGHSLADNCALIGLQFREIYNDD